MLTVTFAFRAASDSASQTEESSVEIKRLQGPFMCHADTFKNMLGALRMRFHLCVVAAKEREQASQEGESQYVCLGAFLSSMTFVSIFIYLQAAEVNIWQSRASKAEKAAQQHLLTLTQMSEGEDVAGAMETSKEGKCRAVVEALSREVSTASSLIIQV